MALEMAECGGSSFDVVGDEVLELVLARLPVTSLLVAGQVCKNWCTVIRSPGFANFYDKASLRKSWFFQCCVNYLCPAKNQGYGYDPETRQWHLISSSCFPTDQGNTFAGSPDGSVYSIFSLTDLSYKREFLSNLWEQAPAMHNSRNSPLLGLVEQSPSMSTSHKLIVAGGVSFFEEDDLAVEMYDTGTRSWEVCRSLPFEFRGNCSRHWMTSAVAGGKFYVAEIYSGAISAFDLTKKVWSTVGTLRPPGVVHSHLLSCQGRLILAGSCYLNDVHSFRLWKVNEATMECGPEIASMPSDLCNFFGPSEDGQGLERKGEGLQCVASGSLIYVFFPLFCREQSRDNQVVVCDLSEGNGAWTLLPPLPSTASYNHVVGFSSPVRLDSLVR